MDDIKKNDDSASSKAGLYRALMAHAIHQDNLHWRRIRTLIAIQAAILAGGYALDNPPVKFLIMILGAILTFCIYLLGVMDSKDTYANKALMDEIAKDLTFGDLANRSNLPNPIDGLYVRFTSPEPSWRSLLSGRHILKVVIWGLIILDIVLAFLYLNKCEF